MCTVFEERDFDLYVYTIHTLLEPTLEWTHYSNKQKLRINVGNNYSYLDEILEIRARDN